jgi:hypothetical protein
MDLGGLGIDVALTSLLTSLFGAIKGQNYGTLIRNETKQTE